MQSRTAKCAQVCGVNTVCFASCQCGYGVHRYENETRPNMALFSSLVTLNDSLHARIFLTLLPLPPPSRPDTEIKCQAYAKFPAGVTGGPNDPCTPAADFQLSAKSDPVCSLMCAPGYEQKGGDGISTLKCGVDGKLTGEMNCTGLACAHMCHRHYCSQASPVSPPPFPIAPFDRDDPILPIVTSTTQSIITHNVFARRHRRVQD